MSTATTSFISKNLVESKHNFKHTAMASHRGVPVSFAMDDSGKIFYSVLDLSSNQASQTAGQGQDQENDKHFWSSVDFNNPAISTLQFPKEIAQVGYGVVPNRLVGNYSDVSTIINDSDTVTVPDSFYSTTARLGAIAPFQALSDGKYIYIFRQSVAQGEDNNITTKDGDPIVNSTLLVDRFILSGTILKLSREVRYQRSRHKTQPASRKDTLSATDVEGIPFYEPTRELAFVANLANSNFSVLLIPGADTEEQRWQLFSHDTVTNKLNSFNIRFDDSIVFDTSDTQALIDAFIEEYKLDAQLIAEVQTEIVTNQTDEQIAQELLSESPYMDSDRIEQGKQVIPEDALTEIIYTIRTGVSKDDCIPASVSEWPLIEYETDGSTIQAQYLDGNGVLQEVYQFQPAKNDQLLPQSTNFTIANGLSSCYYYQQEMDATNQPMKTKAAVMLTMGLEYIDSDGDTFKYIGIFNFSVNGQGQLSRLTKDIVDLPDINVQALDETPYDTLDHLLDDDSKPVGWQQPQQMSLLDIDTNGLSTSGGVLKFAYTGVDQALAEDYSAAAEASFPYVFDDSLGRVNLYLKGKNDDFFVMYFSPNGSKSLEVTDTSNSTASPVLSLHPRLDRDINIRVQATINTDSNTCTLSMSEDGRVIEQWSQLPQQLPQIASILNGQGKLPLGTLAPLGDEEDVKAGYLDGEGTVKIRTTIDNNLMFNASTAYANDLAAGATHTVTDLSNLSAYLHHHTSLHIANKTFELQDQSIEVEAEVLYKSYLSGLVETSGDIDALWSYLKDDNIDLIQEIPEAEIINTVTQTTINEGALFSATDTTLSVTSTTDLAIEQGDYLQIGSEILRVLAIYGNDLEVNRGQLSTVAEAHSNGSTVTHAACLLNGTLNAVAQLLTLTSTAALGVVRGDTLKIDDEVLQVESVTGNRLRVTRGAKDNTGTATTAAAHPNGVVVELHQKGAPNSKAHLKEVVLIGSKTTLTGLMTDDSITSLTLDLLEEGNNNEADIANRLAALRQNLTDLLLELAKVRVLTFTVQDTNTESVDRLEAGLQVEVAYDTTSFTCTPENLLGISTTGWEHPRSYLFNASITQNNTPTKTIINQEGFDGSATTLTVSSVVDLGIDINAYLLIDEEVVQVTEIQESTHQLTVTRAQLGTTDTAHDNRATVTHYPCWVDAADIDSTATALTVTSAQALGVAVGDFLQIEDEVLLVDAIDSNTQLTVTRQQKGSTAAAHAQGTGMYIHSRGTLEIDNRYDYTYDAKNAIGQWEDWEASLAMEFTPSSASSGALLTTAIAEKLDPLNPSKQGLSAEVWIKPTDIIGNTGATSTVLYHKNGDPHYSLGIQKEEGGNYRCFATLGTTKYITSTNYPFLNSDNKEVWKHLAFTHQKYWGYQLASGQSINCGNSDGLHLNDEFSLEVLVTIDQAGTLLKKEGEYKLEMDHDKRIIFYDGKGVNYLFEEEVTDSYGNVVISPERKPDPLTLNEFVKITLIRSKDKPQTAPSTAEYPMTGGDASDGGNGDASDKWYADKEGDDLIKGMAEKQDQLEQQMDFAQFDMLGNTQGQQVKSNPSYYHTLIITDQAGTSTEWQTSEKEEVTMPQAFQEFTLGGNNFAGTFDSVRIWNRALSTGDAKLLDLPENKARLVAHWRMEEGEDQYLYDSIGEHHGVATGSWVNSPRTNQQGQFQFYIDGAKVTHETEQSYTIPSNVEQFSVGGYKTASGKGSLFKGSLEEIRVWNQARSHEEITDNAFGRLKGEWDQLLANYPFDRLLGADDIVRDASTTTANLSLVDHTEDNFKQVLSNAPVATEIPQIRSALTGVITPYYGTLQSRPQVVEYGDVQKNEDGTLNGILKRCYSFIDAAGTWHRMTGYKVGNLVSQWYSQAQFAPQVMGYLEGPPPVPRENFLLGTSDTDNSITFNQAEEVSYNYSSSKEAGWNVGVEAEGKGGGNLFALIAPFGIGIGTEMEVSGVSATNWETSGTRSESYERGVAVNTSRSISDSLAISERRKRILFDENSQGFQDMGNTGIALVKSKTADIYLLRLAHNNALVSISWQPNPDIPEDVNIISFPINPLYTKQGVLDGKLGDTTDSHYPQAQGAYGEYSYFKPREAYRLKKDIEREKASLQSYFEDAFDVSKTNSAFNHAAAWSGAAQLLTLIPGAGIAMTAALNQILGQVANQEGYNKTELKDAFTKMGSQRNLVNTYVWTIEGGFYAESTEVAETQQETFANETSLSLGGGFGLMFNAKAAVAIENQTVFSSGSSFTLTKSKTKASSASFGLDVSVDVPTAPRYQYGGADGRSLVKTGIDPGTVDAYRFMSFYLEPKGKNFTDLFTKVIDPIWLAQNPDPNAQALRQAAGNMGKAKPCWRILHRVTYVSRILPEFTAEAPPSLEKATRVAGFESNYGLIKRFEPYLKDKDNSEDFFNTIEDIINTQLPEFKAHKQEVKEYLALYFNMDMN